MLTFGDRTLDLSYMIQRELLLPFGEWVNQVQMARDQYAQEKPYCAAAETDPAPLTTAGISTISGSDWFGPR